MEMVYIALVDTPGIFAAIIRKVIKLQYVHVVLSADSRLDEAYSIGRRHPAIPFFAGFEREDKQKIADVFPAARYHIFGLPCSEEQKKAIVNELRTWYTRRYCYHYCLLGLPFLLMNKPFYQKNHYTCSSFTAKILEKYKVLSFDKHFSLVTPRDFYEVKGKTVLFEGELNRIVEDGPWESGSMENVYEV